MGKGGTIKPKGLYTSPNQLDAPDGALSAANNVVIRRPGVIEPRRGMNTYGDARSLDRLHVYKDTLHGRDTSNSKLYYYSGGTWTTENTVLPNHPDANTAKMRYANIGQNAYFTTASGVYQVDAVGATPKKAGFLRNVGFDVLAAQEITAGNLVRTLTTTVTATISNSSNLIKPFKAGDVVMFCDSAEVGPPAFAVGPFTLTSGSSSSFVYPEAGANGASSAAHYIRHQILRNTGGFLADGYQVAYRCVIKKRDTNGNFISSQVSGRHIVRNATGTLGYAGGVAKDVFLRVLLSSETGNNGDIYVDIYRSKQVLVGVEPNDELQLCYSKKVSAVDFSRGYVETVDIRTDALLGAFIYTATNQEGLENNNWPPPNAKDITAFGNCVFYGNTTGLQTMSMQMIGVPSASDTFTVYMTGSTQITPFYNFNGEYPYKSDSGASAGRLILPRRTVYASATDNIRFTCQDLCEGLNTVWVSGVYSWNILAYYEGTDALSAGAFRLTADALTIGSFSPLAGGTSAASTDAPIKYSPRPATNILAWDSFSCLRFGTNDVYVQNSGGTAHGLSVGDTVTLITSTAAFPSGEKTVASTPSASIFTYTEAGVNATEASKTFVGGNLYTSEAESAANRTAWSKPGNGESAPLFNYVDHGDKSSDVIRMAATRDSMFVFKEDGVWRCTGSDGSFVFEQFDPTLVLLAPDSAVSIDNNVIALTQKGVVLLTDTGTELLSMPIQEDLFKLQASASLTKLKNYTFAVANEIERQYELYTISDSSDTTCTQAWVYNLNTKAWTKFTGLSVRHGVYNATDNKRYLAASSDVRQERKEYAQTDYADQDVSVTISSVTSGTVVVLSSASGVSVGDILTQSTSYSRITAIATNTLTLETSQSWSAAAATVKKAISTSVTFRPIQNGAPDNIKMFSEAEVLFGNCHAPTFTVTAKTDLQSSATSMTADTKTLFGQWVGASTAWDKTERPTVLRVDIPQEQVHGHGMSIGVSNAVAWSVWNIMGLMLDSEVNSESEGE